MTINIGTFSEFQFMRKFRKKWKIFEYKIPRDFRESFKRFS